jgi:PAS domain S-box-containing protein
VFPIIWDGKVVGVLLFRNGAPKDGHGQSRLSFAQLYASRLAIVLRDRRFVDRFGERTQRISRASYEAERRLRMVEPLKEHFEAAADGMLVVEEDGQIIFVNHVASVITGFASDALVGQPLDELVPDEQKEGLEHVIATVLKGQNLEPFDLDLSTTSGQPVCVSVSTSTVLAKTGGVVLSFREVTAERALENELRQTKEFLEKLIDSTVDGIIAADLRGMIILYNLGAERIFGYSAAEVVGKKPIWELYPEGLPKQVMRMLRSQSYGGVGHLEQTRREILARSGERVPVNMTASIVYEGGREVATVGIFSDLRERIRIEQRLLKAQEKLEVSEKLAVVAQLAGAAAHELNQPLTSIMAYSEFLDRETDPDSPHKRAISTIASEAERMAEIVRKIGRITRFETKEYVGSASILDLDRSAADSAEWLADYDDDEEEEAQTALREPLKMEDLVEAEGDGADAKESDVEPTLAVGDEPTTPITGTAKLMELAEQAAAKGEEGTDD